MVEFSFDSNAIIFKKEISEAEFNPSQMIAINQRFIDKEEPHIFVDGVEQEKNIDKFLINRVYSCEITVTNSSSKKQEL